MPRALYVVLLSAALAQAQGRPKHNNTYVRDDDARANALVQEASRAAAAGDPDATADRLHAILLAGAGGVVPLRGRELFTATRRWAQIRLLSEREPFGPEVLARWRTTHDVEANSGLRGAIVAGDEAEVTRLLDLYPAATDAPAALLALSDRALLRGDPDAALGFLLRVPEHVAPSEEARWLESDAFRRRREHLAALAPRRPAGWPTLGGDATRARSGDPVSADLVKLWETAFLTEDPYAFHPPPAEEDREHSLVLPFYPVCDDERLYVHTGGSVVALDRRSGKLLFYAPKGAGRRDDREINDQVQAMLLQSPGVRAATVVDGVLYFNRLLFDPDSEPRGYNQLVAFDVESRSDLWIVHTSYRARRGPAILRRKLFFRGAPAVAGTSLYVYGAVRSEGEDGPTRKEEAFLFCFDRRTGQLVWHRFLGYGDTEAAPRLPPLSGLAPAVSAGVVVAVSGLGVAAALDAVTGEILWLFRYDRQPIRARQRLSDWNEEQKVHLRSGWRREPPRIQQDTVYFAPIDADAMYACWLRGARSRQVGHTLVKWDRSRTRVWGYSLLEYVAGLTGDRIFYVGRRDVRQGAAVTYQTVMGHRVREDHTASAYGRLPPVRRAEGSAAGVPPEVYGRPVLAGRELLVPTADVLYRFDIGVPPPRRAVDDEQVDEIPLLEPLPAPAREVEPGDEAPASFGTLLALDGFLYAVTSDRVICYGPRPE